MRASSDVRSGVGKLKAGVEPRLGALLFLVRTSWVAKGACTLHCVNAHGVFWCKYFKMIEWRV